MKILKEKYIALQNNYKNQFYLYYLVTAVIAILISASFYYSDYKKQYLYQSTKCDVVFV